MIVRSCIRIAAVMALRNSTWADERVYDSENTPLSEAVKSANAPFVVVYTEDVDDTIEGSDMLSPEKRQMKLVVELGIAGMIPQTDGGSVVEIPVTDDALERAVDMLEYQVASHLFHTPLNPWGELLRQFCPVVHSVASVRAGEAERGVRWAARQRTMIVDTIGDPVPGVILSNNHAISKFIAMAKNDEDMALGNVATLIESMISTVNAPTWRQAQAALGLTEEGVRGIGIAPPYATPDDEVDLKKVMFEQDHGEHSTADNVNDWVNPVDIGVPPKEPPIIPTEEMPV